MLFCALLLELAKEKTIYTIDLSAGKLLQADDPRKDFAYDAEERDASVVAVVISLAFVRIEGNDLPPLVSCGTAPSCQHWQRTSYNGNNKVVLQCFIRSGDPIASWGLA